MVGDLVTINISGKHILGFVAKETLIGDLPALLVYYVKRGCIDYVWVRQKHITVEAENETW